MKIFLFYDYELGFLAISENGNRLSWSSGRRGNVGDDKEQEERWKKDFQKFRIKVSENYPKDQIVLPEKGDLELIEAIEKHRDERVHDFGETPESFDGMLRRAKSDLHNSFKYR